jgi:anaerobic C4-dicarboxylate transporter
MFMIPSLQLRRDEILAYRLLGRGSGCLLDAPTYSVSTVGQESVEQVEIASAIMAVILAAAGINKVLSRTSSVAAVKGSIMTAGMVAPISIAGFGWLGSSFFEQNRHLIIHSICNVVQQHTWVFALGLFALSVWLAVETAMVLILMPVGIALALGSPEL